MTRLLVSVRNVAEAGVALAGGADIIDIKEPLHGALGAVAPEELQRVVRLVAGRRPVSATVGDLPPDAAMLAASIERTAACGVDYVKIGFSADAAGAARRALTALAPQARAHRLIAVLFADAPDFASLVEVAARSGFVGVMVDTADKRAGSLCERVPNQVLSSFVARARAAGLLTGLAGSLRVADIETLTTLGADYLGFRGAACEGARGGDLCARRLAGLRTALDRTREETAAA